MLRLRAIRVLWQFMDELEDWISRLSDMHGLRADLRDYRNPAYIRVGFSPRVTPDA